MADGTVITLPRYPSKPVVLTLDTVKSTYVRFNVEVKRRTPDLKVTVYYSTNSNLTVYKHTGKSVLTEFDETTFEHVIDGLSAQTKYYYFVETVSNGINLYTQTASFTTSQSLVDEGIDLNPENGNM